MKRFKLKLLNIICKILSIEVCQLRDWFIIHFLWDPICNFPIIDVTGSEMINKSLPKNYTGITTKFGILNELVVTHYVNGLQHRNDGGPTELHFYNGRIMNKEFRTNGLLHRENNLPAIIFSSGSKMYYYNNKLHNLNGPAWIETRITTRDKDLEIYFIHGKQISKEQLEFYNDLIKYKNTNNNDCS